jgi:uncharacterized protein YcfJ
MTWKTILATTMLVGTLGAEVPVNFVPAVDNGDAQYVDAAYRRHRRVVVRRRSGRKSAAIVGGSAAGGALIGGLAGGGKGAAIGAVAGGGAGLIYDRKTHKKVIREN